MEWHEKQRIKSYHRFINKGFNYTEEIRQGDSLSPFLFNLLMNRIIEEVETKYGIPNGTE